MITYDRVTSPWHSYARGATCEVANSAGGTCSPVKISNNFLPTSLVDIPGFRSGEPCSLLHRLHVGPGSGKAVASPSLKAGPPSCALTLHVEQEDNSSRPTPRTDGHTASKCCRKIVVRCKNLLRLSLGSSLIGSISHPESPHSILPLPLPPLRPPNLPLRALDPALHVCHEARVC